MTGRLKFILILGGILVIAGLLGAGGFFLFRNINSVAQNQNDSSLITNYIPPVLSVNGVLNLNVSTALNRNSSLPSGLDANSSQAEVSALGRSFAERYGSYSSKNAYQNLRDLRLFMSDRLWRASEQLMQASTPSEEYFGVTSRSLRVEVSDFEASAGRASVQVTLQRRESRGENEPKLYYQTLTLQLTEGNNAWLVDELAWGPVF